MKNGSKDPLVGTRIREYEILDVIGKGGMGAVYRARHVYLDEERAIKVIHAPLAEEESPFIDRFIREAKILTKLRHPDLVELYEFGRLDEKMFFMVMELMKGETVHERLKKLGRIPLNESLRIVRDAAHGLHVAHQKGIVHRDISPDNLMLLKMENGTEITKVIDFGIAKPTYQETQRYTIGDMFMGKPQFSSPEQCGFHEEGEEIDNRADIYSLAVTLYYMLSGKLPFYSATPQGYLVKHASEAPKPISVHFAPDELPEGVENLIAKALSKKRQDRHSSMAEFAEEIDRILNPSSAAGSYSPTQITTGEFRPGLLFARRYEIEKKIGRGGMGVVYKAVDKFLEIPVALKTINPEIADERTLNRLKREVILARKISHPNVCRIYDIGESDGIDYVSMELLEGRSIAEMLVKEGAIPVPEALLIIKQILDAMEAAHSEGVLHRDLKPQNVIVDHKGRAHIMDFGISTSADVTRLTQTGGMIGTPRYMAPEQFGGAKPDHRADIYSIGIILFEMLTSALPFEANTPATVMYAHLHSTPRRPTELISNLPIELENVVLKALEKNPDNRFQTVIEFRNALEPILKSVAASAPTFTEANSVPFASPDMETKQSATMVQQVRAKTVSPVAETIAIEPDTMPSGRRIESPPRSFPITQLFQSPKKKLLIAGAVAASVLIALVIWLVAGSDSKNDQIAKETTGQKANQQQVTKTQPPAVVPKTTPAPSPVKSEVEPPSAEPPKGETPSAELPSAEPSKAETPSVEPPSAEPSKVESAPVEPPKVETVAPVAGGKEFTVEVMATSWKARAQEKVTQLNEKGYSAFLGENKTEKGITYKVRVGRFSNQAAAKDMASRLKKELQVQPWITSIPNDSASSSESGNVSVPEKAPEKPAQIATEGTISFSAPFPVKIFNGKDLVMDTSTSKSRKLPPGNYTLTLTSNTKAFIGGFRQTLEVKAGENTVIPAPPIGYLSIQANPGDCRITIDESYQASTPIVDLPIQAGKHRVFVEWRSLEVEDEITIEIRENQKTRLRGFVTDDSVGVVEE